jgi:hypothetical protein
MESSCMIFPCIQLFMAESVQNSELLLLKSAINLFAGQFTASKKDRSFNTEQQFKNRKQL